MKSYPRIARIKAETKGEREKARERERERETRRSPIADVANDDAPRSGIDEEKPEIQAWTRSMPKADPSSRQVIIFG